MSSIGVPTLAQNVGSKVTQADLSKFILQDIEFKLLTWMPPGSDLQAIFDWIRATESSLVKLKLMARDGELDMRVGDAVDTVGKMIGEYNRFLSTMRLIDYTDKALAVSSGGGLVADAAGAKRNFSAGYDVGLAAARFIATSSQEAMKALATSGASLVFTVADSVAAAQKREALEKLSQSQREAEVRLVSSRLEGYIGDLAEITSSLQSRNASVKLPRFDQRGRGKPQELWDSPFAHMAMAYRMLSADRVAAARKFTDTALQVPASVTEVPSAAAYVASFHLIAGHVLEFESRTQAQRSLCNQALACFDSAQSLLKTSGGVKIAYPFQIAKARALAGAGRSDQALEAARALQSLPTDGSSIAQASRAYDLAALLALVGASKDAVEQLRMSYQALPRRDPQALKDPLLAPLLRSHSDQVRDIVHAPLVGNWDSPHNSFIFYADGTFRQKRLGLSYKGRWAAKGQVLELSGRDGLPDVSARYEVRGDKLILETDQTFMFARKDDEGLLRGKSGGDTYSGRRLTADGGWQWKDGRAAAFARFTTSMTASGLARSFWYSYEDPVIGRISQVLEQT